MDPVYSFQPNSSPDAHTLILGSMPGVASLQAGQYYAHSRNSFWAIMHTLYGINPELPYLQRLAALQQNGIALWDVMQSCTRTGSLDSAIDDASIVPNDFTAFFSDHPYVSRVYFNGARAEQAYRKFVLPLLNVQLNNIVYRRLPSTSPANASYSLQRKIDAWRIIKI